MQAKPSVKRRTCQESDFFRIRISSVLCKRNCVVFTDQEVSRIAGSVELLRQVNSLHRQKLLSWMRENVKPLARISHQFGSRFSCIAGFREILRFAQNDNLKQCVILRGGLCPEESLRRFEGEEIFLADIIAACEKCGLAADEMSEEIIQ